MDKFNFSEIVNKVDPSYLGFKKINHSNLIQNSNRFKQTRNFSKIVSKVNPSSQGFHHTNHSNLIQNSNKVCQTRNFSSIINKVNPRSLGFGYEFSSKPNFLSFESG